MSKGVQQLSPHLAWHQAAVYRTNTGIVLHGSTALIVDACLSTADFQRLADFLKSYQLLAGLVTHAHWDHFLWCPLLGSATPRYASQPTLAAMQIKRSENEAQMRELEDLNFGGREYWPRHLLYQERPLDEGRQVLDGFQFEIVRLDGHCQGSAAFLFRSERLLFLGDHLSDLEPPSLDDTPEALEAYLQSLDLMQDLLKKADIILPGHGSPAGPTEAQKRLLADRRYLLQLAHLPTAALKGNLDDLGRQLQKENPDPRLESAWGWELHLNNLKTLELGLA